jgi:hypothetical protein
MKKMVFCVLWVVGMVGSAAAQPAPVAGRSPAELRQICADAMNADPTFAQSIAATVDKKIDQKTIAAHEDALKHVQKNEKHVIYAYAAMWVIAALFVVFLWRRQQALKTEIATLRKDLEAAGKERA